MVYCASSYQVVPSLTKMPGGQTKFSVAWLQYMDSNEQKISEWFQKGKDDYHGYCTFCHTDIKCGNAGKAQLLQHTTKNKHKEQINITRITSNQNFAFLLTRQQQALV